MGRGNLLPRRWEISLDEGQQDFHAHARAEKADHVGGGHSGSLPNPDKPFDGSHDFRHEAATPPFSPDLKCTWGGLSVTRITAHRNSLSSFELRRASSGTRTDQGDVIQALMLGRFGHAENLSTIRINPKFPKS